MVGLGLLASPDVRAKLPFGNKKVEGDFATEPVTKGPFRISVTERGQTDSLHNATLMNQVEGQTTIISIVPEGTVVRDPLKSDVAGVIESVETPEDPSEPGGVITVVVQPLPIVIQFLGGVSLVPIGAVTHKVDQSEFTELLVAEKEMVKQGAWLAGDVVCELDASSLVEKEKQQRITVTQSDADLEKGIKNVEIQVAQNESDNAEAKLDEELAQLDLEKYLKGDFVQERDQILGTIKGFEEDLTRTREAYEFSKRIARKGYKSQIDLEADRIAVLKANIQLDVEQGKLNVLNNYTYERTIKELHEKAAESIRHSVRVKLAGLAALAGFKAEVEARKLTNSVERAKLELMQQQIGACRMVAPQKGVVVYANQSSRRSEPVVIEEGATVRERQAIIKLPDLTKMKVSARVHESKISQVKVGQDVLIKIDAFPNQVFNGMLDSVSSVPVPGSWPNTDLKEYEAEIRITNELYGASRMKPGLTASIEIVVDEKRDDVVQAPVQAVIYVGEKYFAYVRKEDGSHERRELVIGAMNDERVEIKDGLEENEQVIMNARTRLAAEIEKLREELGVADKNSKSGKSQGQRPVGAKPAGKAAKLKTPAGGGRPAGKSKS